MDLQKANILKRIAAWILDMILIAILAVGFGLLLSIILDYDGNYARYNERLTYYEQQYGVDFEISSEEYQKQTQVEQLNLKAAYEAFISDERVLYYYNMVVNLSLIITTIGILLSVLTLEFVIPLLLKNGQTVGKKAFGLGVVREDGVRINTMQLFVRALLGKYTVEIMIPVYILLMFLLGTMGMTGTIVLFALAVAQLLCICITRNNSAIHDKLAGAVVVDVYSQQIFSSTEALLEYTRRIHAERAAKQDY